MVHDVEQKKAVGEVDSVVAKLHVNCLLGCLTVHTERLPHVIETKRLALILASSPISKCGKAPTTVHVPVRRSGPCAERQTVDPSFAIN